MFLNKNPPFNVAFIGGGINSAVGRAHYSALHMDGLFRLVAGAFSRHASVNAESGRAYGVDSARVYSNHRELIAAERNDLDAVIVLTPTSDHVTPVIDALEAGIPVICEKALASTLNEIETIRLVERENSGFLVVTYNYTGYPALREIRAMIGSGELGRLLHFTAEMPQEGFIRVDRSGKPFQPQDWRLHDGEIPTVYLDLGTHLHQIVHYLTGLSAVRVSASQRSYGHHRVIDYVSASVDYEDGVHGSFYFGKSMLGYRNGLRIRIFGSRASIEWTQTNPEEFMLAYADGRVERRDRGGGGSVFADMRYTRFKAGHPAGYVEAFANLYMDIAIALRTYKTTGSWHSDEVFGSELDLSGLRLMQAMVDSANTASATLL